MLVRTPGDNLKHAARYHQASRSHQDPELVLVQEVVNFLNRTSE